MKKIGKYIVLLFLFAAIGSCSEDELGPSVIKDDTATLSAIDNWLNDNFTKPYNIRIIYKIKDIETDTDFNTVPAKPENSWALAKVIKYLWAETFDEYSGPEFLKMYSFRELQMEGTYKYQTSTYIKATASAGIKIVFCGVNNLRMNDLLNADYMTDTYIKTMFHEYTHILNQKKAYDAMYGNICGPDYNGDDWSTRDAATANELGFITPYAGHSAGEDFAETVSVYLAFGQENWNRVLASTTPEGAGKISEKLDIAISYLKNSWDIDLDELRKVFENRKANLKNLDVNI